MASATVKLVGLAPVLRKLGEGTKVTDDERAEILKKAAIETATHLRPTVPRHSGASVAKMQVVARPFSSKVTMPAIPLRFVDLGTKRKNGGVRIRPRRFMAKEKRQVPPRLRGLVERSKESILNWWRR